MQRVVDFRRWQESRETEQRRISAIEDAFRTPYHRERPRDAAEAAFLRAEGTPEHLIGPISDDDAARLEFAAPQRTGTVRGIDLSLLDAGDPDQRRFLIEAEHPELAEALAKDELLVLEGEEMNPGLHLAMHEIVARQLWDDDPPEVWETAKRLAAAGYDRHEIFHMIASVVAPRIFSALEDGHVGPEHEYVDALAALPHTSEAERDRLSGRPSSPKEKQATRARKAARAARKANRRRR